MSGVSIATGVIATDALGGGVGRGLQSPGVLGQFGGASSVTGTVSKTTLATIPIPANALGPNGRLKITTFWSYTSSANSKTLGIEIGGQALYALAVTTGPTVYGNSEVLCRNSQTSQLRLSSAQQANVVNGNAYTALTLDFTAAQSILITGTLTNTGETITLEGYSVEILNP